ncbi:sugar transferase [Priestia aryabhattai]|uniref:sugar transferase n=1 Tax=Priestia aryabhattai TaxID=412384 RepID=UPI0024533428|nr:sugar transferase [Priestia aryabhattai]MDH3134544.1 sugar transferase [Priestia aryabhattai]
MGNLAPIVLFVYNRPELTLQTIKSLQKNILSEQSDLFVFSDGWKNKDSKVKVEQVREIIKDIKGFNTVTIHESEQNKGLAQSIIEGVSTLIKKYGSVIVLEDDLLLSPYFLNYMNSALQYYKGNSKIWSISGYNPILISDIVNNKDVYFTGRACSWGWATWEDRWLSNNWDIHNNREDIFTNKSKQKNFNKYGNDLFPMLRDQKNEHIDSWAIRWCFNQFLNHSSTVYPTESLVLNIGLVGDSTHGGFRTQQLDITEKSFFDFSDIYSNKKIDERFKKYYNLKFYNYLGFFLKKLGIYKQVKRNVKRVYSVMNK